MKKFLTLYNRFTDSLSAHKLPLLLLLFVVLILLPQLGMGQYLQRVFCLIGVYSILAMSLNLITGYMGQTSMGHAALYCLGAYFSALPGVTFGLPFWITMIFGVIGGAFGGLVLGVSTMRLSGSYMAVITLAFAEVVEMIITNWQDVTNGPLGLRNIPRPNFFGIELTTSNGGFYYLMLVLVSICVIVCLCVVNSKFGRAVKAIREDELTAKLMGVNTVAYRIKTIMLSGAMAGIAGAFYASMNRYIDANSFSFDISMTILSIVIFGGMGSIPGMIIGAALLVGFPEAFRSLDNYRYVIYGLILILMMRFRPQGLLGGLSKKPYKLPEGVTAGGSKGSENQEAGKQVK